MVRMNGLESFDTSLEWLQEQIDATKRIAARETDPELKAEVVGMQHAYATTLRHMTNVRRDVAATMDDAKEQMIIAEQAISAEKRVEDKWSELCNLMLGSLDNTFRAIDESGMAYGAAISASRTIIRSWKNEISAASTTEEEA